MEKQQNKFKNRMIKRIALFFISLFTVSISAQITENIEYASPITYEIGGITVSGAKYLNNSSLITISGLVIGEKITIPGDNISSAIKKYNLIKKIFPNQVGLIHGNIDKDEKNTILKKFLKKEIKILVSTTVIEVGINFPEANIMVVENSNKFGLSQLHQLRGRVGRGINQGACILLYKKNLSDNAKKRIMKMKETNDGFEIAKKDLEIRGAGEILGRNQSGLPSFKIADLSFDSDLLEQARQYVDFISQNDPKLETNNGKNLKNLLYLFERDVAIKTLLAG